MQVWRDLIPVAPRNATFTASVGTAGASSWLPADMHGRSVVKVRYVWVGDPDVGRDRVAAVGAAVPPAAQRTRELSYLDLQTMDDQPEGHSRRRYWKGHYLRALDDAAIEAFIPWEPPPAALRIRGCCRPEACRRTAARLPTWRRMKPRSATATCSSSLWRAPGGPTRRRTAPGCPAPADSAQTANEFGYALGIAVLGSIATAMYRTDIADMTSGQVPASAVDTLAGATETAAGLPQQAGSALLGAARDAYTSGMHVAAAVVAVAALAGVAVVIVTTLRHLPTLGTSAQVLSEDESHPSPVPAVEATAMSTSDA